VRPVHVLILHADAPDDAGPLVRALADARRAIAERQRTAFLAAGADTARIVAGPPDGLSFGERLAGLVRGGSAPSAGTAAGPGTNAADLAATLLGGLVVLGSGSIPLATAADLRRFVEVAAGPPGHAIANNRFSADVVAVSRAADLAGLPPLPADNALPRWLEERAGVAVADLRSHWRLGVDIDTPLDMMLLDLAGRGAARARRTTGAATSGRAAPRATSLSGATTSPLLGERLAALTEVLSNRRAELLVAGRVSSATLRWLERGVACRVRALVEERGLRAASRLAQAGATAGSRPPRSVLGELLDRDGPGALAATVARLADAAVIDTRVLLAHHRGADESAWPTAEDRFASDLLEPASIADPWLRDLTSSAKGSGIPILLGGHTLVNGGLRLLAARSGWGRP
jgi:hypothetical protein